jgi:hypothetical protein
MCRFGRAGSSASTKSVTVVVDAVIADLNGARMNERVAVVTIPALEIGSAEIDHDG